MQMAQFYPKNPKVISQVSRLLKNSVVVHFNLLSFSIVIESSMSIRRATSGGDVDGMTFSIGPELDLLAMDSAAGIMWTGGNPYFTDPGFADASQLWMWSDNPDVQPFPH